MTTAAHFQKLVISEELRLWYPEHEPREQDPFYRLFHEAKRRMRELDIPCWRCGVHYADLNGGPRGGRTVSNPLAAYQLEAHHQDIEFSLANAVDIERWWTASRAQENRDAWFVKCYSDLDGFLAHHPDLDPDNHEDTFREFVESEANLTQLCNQCHRSRAQGVHWIDYPNWRALAIWKGDLPAHVQTAP